jgi:hypothetical protein
MVAACSAKPAAPATPAEAAVANTVERDEETAANPYEVHALAGPFASVDAFCPPVELQRCDSFGSIADVANKPVPAPFEEVMYLAVGGTSKVLCHLAVVVDGQWYVHEHAQKCDFIDGHAMSVVGIEWVHGEALLAESTQLAFTFRADEMYTAGEDDERFVKATRTAMILCGVGQSGTPSCTEEIIVSKRWSHEPMPRVDGPTVQGAFDVDLSYDGSVMTVHTDAEELSPRVGDHTIVFP